MLKNNLVKKMKLKKLFIIGLVLLTLCGTLTAISAEGSVSFSSSSSSGSITLNNGDLTINGAKLKIPDEFEEVEDQTKTVGDAADIDGTHVDSTASTVYKKGNDQIEITVGSKSNNQKINEINPANAEKKKINSKDGYLIKGDNKVTFEYLDDGKLVKVVTPNEDLLNKVIV